MELNLQHIIEVNQEQINNGLLNLDIKATKIEDFFLLDCSVSINHDYKNYFITNTFLMFVLELRTVLN
jgi:hypothetical protein